MVTEVKRKSRLNVRLDDSMTIKLERIAHDMGIPASTLGAVAIAEYVNNKLASEKMQERVAVATAEKNAEILTNVVNSQDFLKLLASSEETQPRLDGV